jgi:hypothetical protein
MHESGLAYVASGILVLSRHTVLPVHDSAFPFIFALSRLRSLILRQALV